MKFMYNKHKNGRRQNFFEKACPKIELSRHKYIEGTYIELSK